MEHKLNQARVLFGEARARAQTTAAGLFTNPADTRLCFLHVPKCSGTSLHLALAACYRPWQVYYLETTRSTRLAHDQGVPLMDVRREMLLSRMLGGRHRYVAGHVASSPTLWDVKGFRFATVLRDPVERYFSHYFFSRYKLRRFGRVSEPLEAYIDSARSRYWAHIYLAYFGEWREGMPLAPAVERAKKTLSNLDLVAVVEQPQAMVESFERLLNRPLRLPRVKSNPAPAGESERQVTSALHAKVRAMCEADREIYEYACTLAGR